MAYGYFPCKIGELHLEADGNFYKIFFPAFVLIILYPAINTKSGSFRKHTGKTKVWKKEIK